MTQEYPPHHWTRRLWSWRAEFGSADFWSRQVGAAVRSGGPDGLWPMVSADPRPAPGGVACHPRGPRSQRRGQVGSASRI